MGEPRLDGIAHSDTPHLAKTFKCPPTRSIIEKIRGVLCVDEKSQIQALNRTQPALPMDLVTIEGYTHDYRGFKNAPHQTCLAHLLRRCKHLQAAHPDSPWAGEVQAVLQDGLALRDRANADEIGEHGLASARGRLVARLERLLDAPPPLADAERFARHLTNEFPAVFLFLCDPSPALTRREESADWHMQLSRRPVHSVAFSLGKTGGATR